MPNDFDNGNFINPGSTVSLDAPGVRRQAAQRWEAFSIADSGEVSLGTPESGVYAIVNHTGPTNATYALYFVDAVGEACTELIAVGGYSPTNGTASSINIDYVSNELAIENNSGNAIRLTVTRIS